MTQLSIHYPSGGTKNLDKIEPLCGELNQDQASVSPNFSVDFQVKSFAGRKQVLSKNDVNGKMQMDLAQAEGKISATWSVGSHPIGLGKSSQSI
jgi:hypothetical protein